MGRAGHSRGGRRHLPDRPSSLRLRDPRLLTSSRAVKNPHASVIGNEGYANVWDYMLSEKTAPFRTLVAETRLDPASVVAPLFVREAID